MMSHSLYDGQHPWFDLIVTTLAVWQILTTYHKGHIFEYHRAYFEACDGFVGELMKCVFCHSHWLAGLTVFAALATTIDLPFAGDHWRVCAVVWLTRWWVLTMACVRLYWLGRTWLPSDPV